MEGKLIKKVTVEKELTVKSGDILVWHTDSYFKFTKIAIVDAVSDLNKCLCLLYLEFDGKSWFKAYTNTIMLIPEESDLEVVPREFSMSLIQEGIDGALRSITGKKTVKKKAERIRNLYEAIRTVLTFS